MQVSTRYPGAGARTLIDTVALPIEQQVNGVENMIYMQSTSTSDGTYTLIVTFRIGTDLNFAQVLVQNRVSAALSSLPDAVQKQGVNVQKQSTAILSFVSLVSPNRTYDSLYLANYATIRLKDELARLPGVGNVQIFGAGQYSIRVWLDPEKLKARGLTASDVTQALQQQSQQVAAGQLGGPPTAGGPAVPVHRDGRGQARRSGAVRERHRQDRRGRDHARRRCRPRRARRADLRPDLPGQRPAGVPASRSSRRRARTRSTSRPRSRSA